MKVTKLVLAGVLGTQAASQTSLADATADQIEALKKQVEQLTAKVINLEQQAAVAKTQPPPVAFADSRLDQLDQQVRILERKRELDQEASTEAAKTTPLITAGADGLGFSSADKEFSLRLRGVVQADSRTFFKDGGIVGNDGLILRKARPIIEARLYRDFDFFFMADFGGSTVQVMDAYANYRYRPELQLRLGKMKVPVGLELLQGDVDFTFNERAFPTSLVPNRDVGVQLHGEVFEGSLSYVAGIFNGVGDNRISANADFEDDKEFAGRLILQPFKQTSIGALKGLGFGAAGTYGSIQTPSAAALPSTTGGTLPGYSTDGQQQFFAYNPTGGATVLASGPHWRLAPQAYYYWGPFGLLAEYAIPDQEVSRTVGGVTKASRCLGNTAWQITGSWVLTGEDATYKSVVPRHPFSPSNGGWGAWQLVARYASLDIDDATFPLYSDPASSASGANSWSVGLNWFLNKNVRFVTSFSRTTFQGGGGGTGTTAPAIVARQPENVLFTRLQLAF
jgi:phosphate-selective porin OprO/OprP